MAFVKEDWWHVDKQGRRIGWLWPEDMISILESFYGDRKWVNTFSKEFGFARSTVDRWKDGSTPIPKHVAQIINMLGTLKVRGLPMTPIEAPWLPAGDGANAVDRPYSAAYAAKE
ncbi:hypothetical protein vBRpoSV10_227 [Ruegeria phage vB_RpoS-V10]|nr:hypothetical protein DSS3P8_221 [Roseobacter phage DSS3P8]AWY09349.1 hypothetical protein vBRpoSV10_227 [Ruegeria phage vB_RpoS-V10]